MHCCYSGSRQVTEAAGPKGRFFDRPGGDKKESDRFAKSETKKKKGLYVPLDKNVSPGLFTLPLPDRVDHC